MLGQIGESRPSCSRNSRISLQCLLFHLHLLKCITTSCWNQTVPLLGASLQVFKVADLNFGCATFCALPSFGAVTTFSSHTTVSSHKVSVKDSDIDMCSAIYFLFDHNTNYCTIYLCPHTVLATVWLSPWRSYTIGLDCTPLLSSAVLLPGPTNSRDFYILGHS